MSTSASTAVPPPRATTRQRLRVVDVALFYGERSGGIRTYLDAKAAWARRERVCEHHLVVPGPRERHVSDGASMRHELPSVQVVAANGYRVPTRSRALPDTLRRIRPDVVLLHDPFWRPHEVARLVHAHGGSLVMVHHGSADLDAESLPGPEPLYRRAFRAWMRHAYGPADAVMSACETTQDAGRPADLPLRFGLDRAFRPTGRRRGDHVLYAGRLAREKGIGTLLEAAARSQEPWPLRLMGAGPAAEPVAAQVRRLGLERRVTVLPFVEDRGTLARAYETAACVVMPGAHETFGLVAFEAAASGASTVACATAPSARLLGRLTQTFTPDDPGDLLRAIERARASEPDREAARALGHRHGWPETFAAELAELEALR